MGMTEVKKLKERLFNHPTMDAIARGDYELINDPPKSGRPKINLKEYVDSLNVSPKSSTISS